ncbi:NAD-binding protein [Kitasatospora nipponensis]|uniref:NAD-binding protein n=1 Tax=Kitasatospora nipponensis TaxID=258049 RepID=A0ABN1W5X3_9ACTN
MTQAARGEPSVGSTAPPVPFSDHYIVSGGNALAHRLILELLEHYEVPVVAIVPDLARDHGPRIERIPGVAAVLESGTVTADALRAAGAASARGIALVDGDDQANIHAALNARSQSPGIRIVLRMFNLRLGEHVQRMLTNCAALSGSATAAPAFANNALSQPHTVQVGDRLLCVNYDYDPQQDSGYLAVAADRIDRQDLGRLRLLPEPASAASEFIQLASTAEGGPVALGRVPGPRADWSSQAVLQTLARQPRVRVSAFARLRYRVLDALRFFTTFRNRMILGSLGGVIGLSFVLLWVLNRDFLWTCYTTLLDMAGAATPDQRGAPASAGTGGGWQRLAQVVITLCGVSFVSAVTAFMVDVLASLRRGLPRSPSSGLRDHVIVVGLGNVGTRVATLIHELGVPVACLEIDPQARGIAAMQALRIPVVVGDGLLADQLRTARAQHAQAVVAVTSDDAVNLEAALEARELRGDLRVVLRFFDDDFARHVYAKLGNVASRSVSYLAAPAFAAALMGREVLGTLSVFRHVLLVAELTAEEGTAPAGMSRADIEALGGIRVLALRRAGGGAYDWHNADRGRPLVAGDRVAVVATRIGLARLNTATPEPSVEPAGS